MSKNNALKYGFLTGALLGVMVFWIPRVAESPSDRLPASMASTQASSQDSRPVEGVLRQAQGDRRAGGVLCDAGARRRRPMMIAAS